MEKGKWKMEKGKRKKSKVKMYTLIGTPLSPFSIFLFPFSFLLFSMRHSNLVIIGQVTDYITGFVDKTSVFQN